MNLFTVVPEELFSILASPNRRLYADALEILYEAYQDSLKIREESFYMLLRNRLEQQLAQADFEDEDIYEEELRDVSGRARFLIRKLYSKKWFTKERDKDFQEYIIVPNYSSKILEMFHQLLYGDTRKGSLFVYSTYSALKVAQENKSAYEKMLAVYSAYEHTDELIKLLKEVYHNVNRFFLLQLELYQVNEVLAKHYDDFGENVVEKYIKPLKIKDSVPKYKIPIQQILDEWLQEEILQEMAQAALQEGRQATFELCREELLRMIFKIKDRYDALESDFLDEIDKQVRRYTRATTLKLEGLTTHDQNVRGNVNYLLSRLADSDREELVEGMAPCFNLSDQCYLAPRSLYHRREVAQRVKSAPVVIEFEEVTGEAQQQMEQLLKSSFSKQAVQDFMLSQFGDKQVIYSNELQLGNDVDYIMQMMALLRGGDHDSFYTVEYLEDYYLEGIYKMPRIRFTRKEGK